jgi:hypothetical protein
MFTQFISMTAIFTSRYIMPTTFSVIMYEQSPGSLLK